jgi:hypothetical protein
MSTKSGLPRLVLVLVPLALCTIMAWTSHAPAGAELTVAGAPVTLSDGEVTSVTDGAGHALRYDTLTVDDATVTRVRVWKNADLTIKLKSGSTQHRHLTVVKTGTLYLTAVLFAALALTVPYLFWTPDDPSHRVRYGPWYQLLSEPKGGYSLARVQLLLWYLPVVVLYGASCFVSRAFMPIDTQLQLLLGLSGLTTALGTAANPKTDAAAGDRPPNMSDMLADWNGHGDVSRYQYLLLSMFGSATLVLAFLSNLEFPQLPSQFLYLIAASQGTYIATKATKTMSAQNELPAATHAPASVIAVMSNEPNTRVNSPPELSEADGSFGGSKQ